MTQEATYRPRSASERARVVHRLLMAHPEGLYLPGLKAALPLWSEADITLALGQLERDRALTILYQAA